MAGVFFCGALSVLVKAKQNQTLGMRVQISPSQKY
jgi:hypothetical protein